MLFFEFIQNFMASIGPIIYIYIYNLGSVLLLIVGVNQLFYFIFMFS
jgi:hypothetical protein